MHEAPSSADPHDVECPICAEQFRRANALAAAHWTSEVATELMRFAREGNYLDGPWFPDVEPVETLCDATMVAIGLMDGQPDPDGARAELAAALSKFIEGWA